MTATLSSQQERLPRYANTWLHWDSQALFAYDREKPSDYEELRKDAADLVKKIEYSYGWEDEFPHPRDRKLYEMILHNRDRDSRGYCIHGDTLGLEDMKRPVVRKFFMRTVEESYLITNQGEELPLNFTIDTNIRSCEPELAAELRYSGNQAKPKDEHEAYEMARLNKLIHTGIVGMEPLYSPYGFLHLWKCLPLDRQPEDALLYLQTEAKPSEQPRLTKHLYRWSAEADEDSGMWLGRQIIDGCLWHGGRNARIYDALMLDEDFQELMREKF